MKLFQKLVFTTLSVVAITVLAQTQILTVFPKIGNPVQIPVNNIDSVTFTLGYLSSVNLNSSSSITALSSSLNPSSSVPLSSSLGQSSSINVSSSLNLSSSSNTNTSSSVILSSSTNIGSSAILNSSSSGLSITSINAVEWRDIYIYANITTPSTVTDLYIEVRGDSIPSLARFPLQWNSVNQYFVGYAHTPKSAQTGQWKLNLASSSLGLVTDTVKINETALTDTLSAFILKSMVDDRDTKTYKTVQIGKQVWMAENLNYGNYISDGLSASTLQTSNQKFCYQNTESNCNGQGGLYQWHTALALASNCATSLCSSQIASGDHQGICPSGWHIPKTADWDSLQVYLGGSSVAGSKMKVANTIYPNWNNLLFNKGNPSGFSGIPTGDRFGSGNFGNIGVGAYFWEAGESSVNNGKIRNLSDNVSDLSAQSFSKKNGFSIRCVQN